MIDDTRERLRQVVDMLAYPADCDHYCEEQGCTLATPKCRDRQLHRGFRDLKRILDPPHEGLHPNRLTSGDAERIYHQAWKRENSRQMGHHGRTLAYILCSEAEYERQRQLGHHDVQPPDISPRDAEVAATVIQWLGTNVGRSFVERCEKQIEAARAQRAKWPYQYDPTAVDPTTEYAAQAELLASRIFGQERHPAGVRAIQAALQAAREQGRLEGTVS